ncbi:maleylpyruvate isomerase family mycothiol-dependent enzyme [Streptomyces sp. URMC 129]|uniref:maleylpyruvate isomerase family mycothiol-dependent enzyme n=1 Tax=Streptomyces sp. URMC 129 TaxID=3423407 RepID=UPI003F1B1DD6
MNGPAADLHGLQDATDRLLATAAGLDDTALAQPSRLPGWTRGHVLAHLADLTESAARFFAAAERLTEEEWQATVTLRNGVTDSAAALPLRRWVEVELHHIDLDAGHTIADLPGAFTDRALAYLTDRFTGHPALPPLELRTDDGRTWPTGGSGAHGHVIAGSPAALVGWLSGRTPGTGLTIGGVGGSLPELPPL